MEKYLQAILSEVKTIIIPNLGALTITNADTGEFMFMTFLKHDDGQLSAFIAKTDGIDDAAAKEKVASMVSEIQARLASGASYAMPNFGQFIMNDGDIDFAPWSAEDSVASEVPAPAEESAEAEVTYIPEASPEPPVVEEPHVVEAIPEPPVVEEPIVEEAIPEPPVAEEPIVEEEIPEPTVVEEPIVEEASPAPIEPEATATIETPTTESTEVKENLVEGESYESNEVPLSTPVEDPPIPHVAINPVNGDPIVEPDPSEVGPPNTTGDEEITLNVLQKERLAESQEKLEKLRKAKEQKPPRKKRSVAFWMLMTLLGLLVTGGVLIGVFFEDVKQHIPFLADTEKPVDKETDLLDDLEATLEEPSDAEEEVDEIQEEAEVEEEEEEEEEEVETPPVVTSPSGNLPWHWIAGSFSVEANANRLATKLRDQGLSSKVMQVGGMYLVSAKAFASKEAALAGRSEVSASAPGSWLYEMR